jgi:hypothetical protein
MILVSNVNAESPTDKGVYRLSGSISYSNTNKNGGTMTSITPAFIYFVYPNIAVGASILYWDFKTDNSESKTYGIGPVVRYYFGKDAIYPFASVEYTYTKDKFESNSSGLSYKSTGHGNDVTLGLGIDYFLSKNVALEPIVRYTFSHSDSSVVSHKRLVLSAFFFRDRGAVQPG